MTPLLLIKTNIKYFSAIGMIVFGLALTGFTSWMMYEGGSYWWIIGLLLGVFCIYNWISILINGSMSIAFLIKDGYLYISYNKSSQIVENLDAISNGELFTNEYALANIQNFWKYTYRVNGGTTTEEIKVVYNGKEQVLIDLAQYEVKLKDEDLNKMVHFLCHFHPSLQIGKP